MYDLVSGKQLLRRSYYLRKTKALELFPMLKRDQLKGALVYYDGKFCLILGFQRPVNTIKVMLRMDSYLTHTVSGQG